MPQFPVNLRYTLSRRQRLVPHLRIWGPVWCPCVLSLFLFVGSVAVEHALKGNFCQAMFFVGLALGGVILLRPMFVGLFDVLLVPRRDMDVAIDENGAGFLIGAERWWLWLDSFTDMRKFRADTWTLQHWNGCVLHIAASAIGEDLIDHIRTKMEFGRTPEGFQAAAERGRRIQAILRERRGK